MLRSVLLAFGFIAIAGAVPVRADSHAVTIRFAGAVNGEPLGCGRTYSGVGASKSDISPIDFRLYAHDIRLVDERGNEHRVELEQGTKWQIERLVLLDFEDASGGCTNGTPETNFEARGSVEAAGPWAGVRFVLGVPFNRNHTDPTRMPPPLNLTAMAWAWNAGRKFARLDFSSSGLERGYALHLGSTGCTPNETKVTVPTSCSAPNRAAVELPGFDPETDTVVADLGWLLRDSDLDANAPETASGCMSSPLDPDCAPVFANLGLDFPGTAAGTQRFFRVVRGASMSRGAGLSAE